MLQLIILCSQFKLSKPHSLNATAYIFFLTTCGQCRAITRVTKGSHCGDDRVQSGNRLSHNSWRRIPQGVFRKHALNTMCYFLHVSPLLSNEQEPRVQIDRVPHSAVSVVAMTSSVAALHLQSMEGVQHEATRLFRMCRHLLFVEKWWDGSYIIRVRKPNTIVSCYQPPAWQTDPKILWEVLCTLVNK